MSRELQQEFSELKRRAGGNTASEMDYWLNQYELFAKKLLAELAKPEQEPTACGYDETVGMCTNNPCCEQTPVAYLWECIGRWSAYLAANGKQGNLAPPRKEWVGLTDEEMPTLTTGTGPITMLPWHETKAFIRAIEAKLKEKNGAT